MFNNSHFFIDQIIYNSWSSYGPRVQPDWQLVYVYKGSIEVVIEEMDNYIVNPGEVTLLNPGPVERFYFSKRKETRHGWCTASHSPDMEKWINVLKDRPVVIPLNPMMKNSIEQSMSLKDDLYAKRSGLLDTLIRSVFLEFIRNCDLPLFEEDQALNHPSVEAATEFMEDNLDSFPKLSLIAKAAGVTSPHLIHLFHKHKKQTPMKYFMQMKVNEAARLLRDSGYTVAEIAVHSGFSNPQHFSRVFRTFMNQTPLKYRMKHWKA